MNGRAYYNEFDPHAAAWLRELIREGHIADGDVDERSIVEVQPDDVCGYSQCHFFAGIGGWSYALRLAGWPDDQPVWTGSCPCQPWSIGNVAHGGARGFQDDRHLWPEWRRLIVRCNPVPIFGEQVVRAIKLGWLDQVLSDLEAMYYTSRTRILRAKDFGADHERKRLYFVADANRTRWQGHQPKQRIPFTTPTPQSVDGDSLIRGRRALAGDYSDLLPCNGLSVAMERKKLRGYGNAIVPQVAAAFIQAYCEAKEEMAARFG